jgi:aspartate/methionine/tyrosine aminotransferase
MRDAYRLRRDATVAALGAADLFVTTPHGAFYIFADVSAATDDTRLLARALVLDHGLAVAPGETFGPRAAGLVRLSLASAPEVLEAGVKRLAEGVAAWSRQSEPLRR